MKYLFTSESVSEGHPDKIADQISDAILDEFLRQDPESKVACETVCTTGTVVVMGEARSEAYVDIQETVRKTIARIGYDKPGLMFNAAACGILSAIHEQSPDIHQGVVREDPDEQGAGDQGIMFGYACRETKEYMPLALMLSHITLHELACIRKEGRLMPYLRPDSKSQYTIEYDSDTHKPLRIHTIVLSTQHDEFVAPEMANLNASPVGEGSRPSPTGQDGNGTMPDCTEENRHICEITANANTTSCPNIYSEASSQLARTATPISDTTLCPITYSEACAAFGEKVVDEAMHAKIEKDVREILLPRVKAKLPPETAALFGDDFRLLVNPTGKFVIGGPAGDTGLTGRKIIVDTYGGKGAHGGGAFSGKDPSKVDRSAAYAARHIAKNLVAAGVADEVLVQLSYAIGVASPVSIFVNTYGTAATGSNGKQITDEEIARVVSCLFDLRPAAIIRRFGLKNPIYSPTAAYGHFGREPFVRSVKLIRDGAEVTRDLQFFAWEKLDAIDTLRSAFGL